MDQEFRPDTVGVACLLRGVWGVPGSRGVGKAGTQREQGWLTAT